MVVHAQVKWVNVDAEFLPLPASVHVFRTTDTLAGKPNIAYYVIADLKNRSLVYDADTSHKRRLTPTQFNQKNNSPLVVVNCTFFSFQTNQNLSVVVKDKKLVGYNIHSVPGRGRDTFTYRHPLGSAIGISKKRTADVAWLFTDSTRKYPYAVQKPVGAFRNDVIKLTFDTVQVRKGDQQLKKWKMQTAVGGGPVLIQNDEIKVANNEELKFAGNAINDKHPRTAMGYTRDNKLIILVVQGRFPGIAEGATLIQLAQMMKDIGCYEALNLDGGGSSCMLVNGKETIRPSDAGGQRPVPAVFMISRQLAMGNRQ